MRPAQLLLARFAFLAVLAGCGRDSSPPQGELPIATSDATVVRYPFTLKKGDGVRMKIRADVEVSAAGTLERSQTMHVDTTLDLRCTAGTPEGDRSAHLRMSRFETDAAPAADRDPGLSGSMTIGSDRSTKAVELGGRVLPGREALANPFVTGGLSIYLPIPAGSMRVGETVVLPSTMPEGVLPPPLQHAVEGATDAPTFRGVYTLRETHERGGVLIGDFDIDISLQFSGTVAMGSRQVATLVDMSCRGRQSFALNTGLPVGSGASRVLQQVEMTLGREKNVMRTNADIRADCEPLPEDPSPDDD